MAYNRKITNVVLLALLGIVGYVWLTEPIIFKEFLGLLVASGGLVITGLSILGGALITFGSAIVHLFSGVAA